MGVIIEQKLETTDIDKDLWTNANIINPIIFSRSIVGLVILKIKPRETLAI